MGVLVEKEIHHLSPWKIWFPAWFFHILAHIPLSRDFSSVPVQNYLTIRVGENGKLPSKFLDLLGSEVCRKINQRLGASDGDFMFVVAGKNDNSLQTVRCVNNFWSRLKLRNCLDHNWTFTEKSDRRSGCNMGSADYIGLDCSNRLTLFGGVVKTTISLQFLHQLIFFSPIGLIFKKKLG